jgi:putative transposase
MSNHFQKELKFLGIESSPAFVRAPEGNGCAERFIRTLKQDLLWVRTFDAVEDLRRALLEFRETYNTTWLISSGTASSARLTTGGGTSLTNHAVACLLLP